MRTGRIIFSSLLGSAAGALSGAALLGIPTYLSKETGFLGPESNWALLGAMLGAIFGVVPGALIGFLVARFKATVAIGALMGAGIGIIILVVLFATGLDPFLDSELFLTGWASIPIAGIIGVLVAVFNRQPRPMPPSAPLDQSKGRIFGGLVN